MADNRTKWVGKDAAGVEITTGCKVKRFRRGFSQGNGKDVADLSTGVVNRVEHSNYVGFYTVCIDFGSSTDWISHDELLVI